MFSYDSTNNTLKICKVPESEVSLGLLEYQRASFNKYITETVYKDIDYLLSCLKENLQVTQIDAEVEVCDLHVSSRAVDIKKQPPAYYSVMARLTIDNVRYPDPVEILRIPAMDDDGILNLDGKRRVLLMQLVAAERISYAADKRTISVTTPKRNITILMDGKSDILVKYGSNTKIPFHKLLRAYNAIEHVYPDISTIYSAPAILSAFAADALMADESIVDEMGKLNVYNTYSGVDYSLGKTRDALNTVLSLDRAKGRILSRPVGTYGKGTRVDDAVLKYAYTHGINEIYVQAVPDIVGYSVAQNFRLTDIPAGTRNNDRLRAALPQYAEFSSIPEYAVTELYFTAKETLTAEDINLFVDVGLPFLNCKRPGSRPITVTFEEEVIGNYTVRLGDVFGANIPNGRSHDEWVYYYNNPTYQPTDSDNLNTHDLAALYSLCAFINTHPEENYLLDKDFGLLKRVDAADEIFSKSLRAVIPQFVKRYKTAMQRKLQANLVPASSFIGLTDMWIKHMRDSLYLDNADTLNPIASVAQTNFIVSNLPGEVPEKMRLLSMGYYGRICPYETPAGKKIGITNTRAIGAKIEDGILLTPYRRLIKNSSGAIVSVSPNITYMDAQQEAHYRIGDLLSLQQKDGQYLNNKVMARVPAANNQVTVESVDAFSLEYVNAFCEQHLSPTAALVPFAGSNDASRVSYATHMLKQSILVQGNQVPRVYTSMYRQCFEHSNTYVIRAKKDGFVCSIPIGMLQLTYDDGTEEDIPIKETSVTGHTINFLNFHVKEGDHFKKGDILVDSAIAKEGIYSPGVNLFVAYLADGYNYEDAIELSEHAANQFISISSETVTAQVSRQGNESIRAGREYYYHYIPENGVIANISKQNRSDSRAVSTDVIRSGRHSGILYQIERNLDERRAVEYRAHLLSFNRLRTGDKLAGRHSNKGTVSIVKKNSEMPCFMNGRPIDILLNPCGVPSRMNIGQNFEAFLGFVATLLDIHIESNSFNGATKGDIKLLMQYVWDLANNENATTVCSKYPMLPKELHDRAKMKHASIREWAGCFNPDGTAFLWNPETGKCLENPATIGVAYILKLKHEVNGKLHARAGMLEEEYSQISKQPTEGASAGGGQRMGEMELCALAAYGATDLLDETLNASSDNVIQRIDSTLNMLGLPELQTRQASVPHSVEMFRYLLEALGIKLSDDEGILPPCDADASDSREVLDLRGILSRKASGLKPDSSTLVDTLSKSFKEAFK